MKILRLNEVPEMTEQMKALNSGGWPEFLLQWKCPAWKKLFTDFAEYQALLMEDGKLAGLGHTIPLYWDKNLKEITDDLKLLMDRAVETREKGLKPNLLLALAAVVAPEFKGRGLSSGILGFMKTLAREHGIKDIMLPTRPTEKHKYPLTPIDKYALWKREDGAVFDPWTRAHLKMGGEMVKTSEACITVEASIPDWEKWTGLAFPETGEYVIEGGLRPLKIDREKGLGLYTVPCIWMKYTV